MDLSVLIPARNEMWLARTVRDVLDHAEADTEVIVVLDGHWPNPPLFDHPRLRVTHCETIIGQRAATNLAAKMSNATYVMKLDAHCSVDQGFDRKLIEADRELGRPDVTQVPAMYNLHAFNWKCQACGIETYQGPTPTVCGTCKAPGPFERVVYWDLKAGGVDGRERRTEFWRFDADLHFQYWHDYRKRPEAQGDLVDVLSSVGACFFMRRERFWKLGGLDEAHGSWGQFGTEVACKSWLSGGRHIVNKRTWFAHLFRTQGGDFSFPYANPGSAVDRARAHSRKLWLEGAWPGAVHPLSWLIQKFAPVPDWSGAAPSVPSPPCGTAGSRVVPNAGDSGRLLTKGLVYYTDHELDPAIAEAVRSRLSATGLPIVSVSLRPLVFGHNIVLPGTRGPVQMFKQILAGLEALDTDIAFLVEHDVLYHPSHFTFTPEKADVFYFNEHRWQVRSADGFAVHYRAKQTSGCCASRALLVEHYRKRVAYVEQHGYDRNLGYEPGTNSRSYQLDPHRAEGWLSAGPNIDIRHGRNLSKSKWSIADFRNKANAIDWTEADAVPGWGQTRGRFEAWLAEAVGR